MKSKSTYQKPKIKKIKIRNFFFTDSLLGTNETMLLARTGYCCYDGSGGCSECSYPTAG